MRSSNREVYRFGQIFGPLRSTDKLQGERREESWNKSDQGFNLWTIYLGPVLVYHSVSHRFIH